MSVDKLVDSTQLDNDLASVANAIRTKGGTSAQLAFPAGFVSAVQAIPTGTTPTGTKQISVTQNGTTTHDVSGYASAEVTVNVSSGGEYAASDWMDLTKPTGAISSNAATLVDYHLTKRSGITSIAVPNVTTLSAGCFQNCSSMSSLSIPQVTSIKSAALTGCSSLEYVVAPLARPENVTYAMSSCSALKGVDFGGDYNDAKLSATYFNGCSAMNVLVLRSSSMCQLMGTGCFNNTPFASGKAGGTLYVPQALISSYQGATNWSTILGYANNQIKAIEGSAYATKYVDGTTITT